MVRSIAVTTAAAISLQLAWLWALKLTALAVDAEKIQLVRQRARHLVGPASVEGVPA